MAVDWRNPDYTPIFIERAHRLAWLHANPEKVPALKAFYAENIAQFIEDWGCTFDPRNVERGLPAIVPFLLFPKQREWVEWMLDRWRASEHGVTEKSRDVGVSWLAVAAACSLCLFHRDVSVGFGSRKEDYVDRAGHPKSLFYKARMFLRFLPPVFTDGYDEKRDAPHMRISFPGTGSVITGEAGDNIGRGDRQSIYFVDEADFIERPMLIEASLSATTNCRIDISSANSPNGPFYRKVSTWPAHRKFRLHWRDDPRKDDEWYAKICADLDPVTVAREIDINYQAAATGLIIPSDWVQSAIDAHKVLGFEATGERRGSLDVADEGTDLNSFCARHGVVVTMLEAWSGKGSDIFETVQRAFGLCDDAGAEILDYDADGLGAGVRGDAKVINRDRAAAKRKPIKAEPFRGSGAVHDPEGRVPNADPEGGTGAMTEHDRRNGDFFANAKAQAWWSLRVRFQRTHRAVQAVREGKPNPYDPDDLISIPRDLPGLDRLTAQLCQPTYRKNTAGKVVVDKTPDGMKSPNDADALMISFAPRRRSFLSYLK